MNNALAAIATTVAIAATVAMVIMSTDAVLVFEGVDGGVDGEGDVVTSSMPELS